MESAPESAPLSPSSAPRPWTLPEIVANSYAILFRRLVSIVGPGFLFFMLLTAVDLGLTAFTGSLSGQTQTAALWIKETLFVLGFLACTGLSIGFAGSAVLCDLDGKDSGVGAVFRNTMRAGGALILGTILFNLIIIALGAPGGFAIYKAFGAVPDLAKALGLLLLGCILIYYPSRLAMQWLFFGFVIVDHGAGGWAGLCESRRMMLDKSAGRFKRPQFRAFVVLKLSLVPALTAYVALLMVPLFVVALVMDSGELEQAVSGRQLTPVYVMFQFLHSVAWALIIPIFAVSLALVYWDATRNKPAAG